MADTITRFDSGDMSTNDYHFDSSDGTQLFSKFNIGSVEFDTFAMCRDYGIVWRRDFDAALLRGKQRATRRALLPSP